MGRVVPNPSADEKGPITAQGAAAMASRCGVSLADSIGKVLGNVLEHEHANECEGSPVKSTSKREFAHACAKSVLKFTLEVPGQTNEETVVRSFINQEIPPRTFHQVL